MSLVLTALRELPLINGGDNLARIIMGGLSSTGVALEDQDIIVIAQKVVSKAEGRSVRLSAVNPGARARGLGDETGKDPRLIELILQESRRVLRTGPGVIIVQHRLGFVCANAGIDHSNVGAGGADAGDTVLLLPCDPDGSASTIRRILEEQSGKRLGVMINDSHGRPWRLGTVGVCIGLSGVQPLTDQRGWSDIFGYVLKSTVVGAVDELAAGASLVMGQAAERTPVVHARGYPYALGDGSLEGLVRPEEQDLFR